ncbi:MAG: GNAT family N-acetyltransferase [candidate division Zixibacteria bacterium]|nr:GNAT family N-acetyltransferase [candidate division Zixibacteria bacterium]NIT52204.1 GNAT family N-acetyltransferase [candidate division Zixibacteria bacterium]NIW40197.1 GNAT family N-acetyltransferase [candidate division Zixibacteria bacterium]NIX57311.1 GNAT family N-acetyltransferase [candidate division Zixibacteria bacterium]
MNNNSLPIITKRIVIRKFKSNDAPDIVEYSLAADFWLARNISWEPREDSVVEYYKKMENVFPDSYAKWLDLVIELKEINKVIGSVGIGFSNDDIKQATVGCLLDCNYQGQGFASEALKAVISYGFRNLNLHRVYARTGKLNEASWKLMERIGMRREAHFRKSHTVRNEWDDEYIYAILADEWKLWQYD